MSMSLLLAFWLQEMSSFNFNWMAAKQSGLSLRGEIKSIVELKVKNSSCLLFLRNNDFPLIYKLVSPPGTGAN